MNRTIETIIDLCIGPVLDQLGTRTSVVETQGNITRYVIYDKASNEPIGEGMNIVRDGTYTKNDYYQKSQLRKSIFGSKQI